MWSAVVGAGPGILLRVGNWGQTQGKEPWGPQAQDRHQAPLTVDSEIEVAAVKLVLGGHLTAVAARRGRLGICNVQLKQVDLWR